MAEVGAQGPAEKDHTIPGELLARQIEQVAEMWRFEKVRSARDAFGAQWIEAVRAYILQMLDGEQERRAAPAHAHIDPIAAVLVAVAEELEDLEKLLNDFIGADLSGIELEGVPLDGLRWSAGTTRWPEDWQERIERVSIQVDDDIFEIHDGTHAGHSSPV
ncbi:hypothetical protein [Nocardia paucivorans]|uniref:hypothetical protein n=1 Tax=Nocardia paucivorans TaxID=114259 RepID=UPI000592CF9B|nr:hypothetical protein [Nocardia paucivorans]